MKNENLLLLAEGHKLIALAYAREAGAELNLVSSNEGTTSQNAPTPKEEAKPKVTPKITPKVEEEPEVETEADNEEEGYSLEELNTMTVKQLKEIATEAGIHIPKDTKKADIIDLIMDGADEEVEADVGEPSEDDVAEEAGDDEGEELTIAHVEEMDEAELKELAKDYEVDLPKGKFNKEKAVKAIVDALFEEEEIEAYYNGDSEEESNEESNEEEGDELTPEDLDEMSLTELKELAKDYEVTHPKVIKAEKLRALLVEALFTEEEDEGDDSTDLDNDDLAEEYGLNDMSVEDLTELLVDHKIKAKGNKQALIAKVLEAIEEGVIDVGDEDAGE